MLFLDLETIRLLTTVTAKKISSRSRKERGRLLLSPFLIKVYLNEFHFFVQTTPTKKIVVLRFAMAVEVALGDDYLLIANTAKGSVSHSLLRKFMIFFMTPML